MTLSAPASENHFQIVITVLIRVLGATVADLLTADEEGRLEIIRGFGEEIINEVIALKPEVEIFRSRNDRHRKCQSNSGEEAVGGGTFHLRMPGHQVPEVTMEQLERSQSQAQWDIGEEGFELTAMVYAKQVHACQTSATGEERRDLAVRLGKRFVKYIDQYAEFASEEDEKMWRASATKQKECGSADKEADYGGQEGAIGDGS